MTGLMLAWRPFLDPINWFQDRWWLLLIPMSFGVAMVYKAVRLRDLDGYWKKVTIMSVQIVIGGIGLAAAGYVLVEMYARFIAGMVG